MGVGQNIGRAVLVLGVDSASYKEEISAAKEGAKSLGQEWKKQTVALQGVNDSLKTASRQVQNFTRQFFGDDVIANAHHMAAAVDKVGGAAKLTEANQRRVNAAVSDAIQQYKVLGQEAPRSLVVLQKQTASWGSSIAGVQKETAKQTSLIGELKGAVGPLGAALAGAFSVTSIIAFSKNLVEFAGHISDMSAETGVSVSRVEALNIVTSRAGLTFDDVATAVERMSRAIAGGDKSAEDALRRLHLSTEALIKLSPDEAFIEIGEAAAKIENPMERTRILMDLFGRSGARMGRIFTENFRDVVKASESLDKALDKALIDTADEFGDKWSATFTSFKTEAAKAFASIPLGMRRFMESGLAGFVITDDPTLPQHPKLLPDAASIRGLTDEETKAIERQSEALLKNAQHRIEIAKISSQLFGQDTIQRAKDVVEAIGSVDNVSKLNIETQKKVNEEVRDAIAAYKLLGQVAPASMNRIVQATALAAAHTGDLKLAMQAVPGVEEGQDKTPLINRSDLSGLTLATPGRIRSNVFMREMSQLQISVRRDFDRMTQDIADATADWLIHFRGFKDGALGILRSLANGMRNILGDVLNDIMGGFLRKALGSVATSLGAKGIGQSIAGIGAQAAGGAGLGALFGGGAAAAGASIDVATGTVVGGTAAGGAGLGATLAGLATNPFTIAAAAGIAGYFLLRSKFGKDAVNKPRDQFKAQFDPLGNPEKGGAKLAAQLTAWGMGLGGGPLFAALQAAHKDLGAFQRAEAAIIAEYARHGNPGIKKFGIGTARLDYQDFGARSLAELHRNEAVIPLGGGHRLAGEIALSLRPFVAPRMVGYGNWKAPLPSGASIKAGTPPAVHVWNVKTEVHALDLEGFERVMDKRIVPGLMRRLAFNSAFFSNAVAAAR